MVTTFLTEEGVRHLYRGLPSFKPLAQNGWLQPDLTSEQPPARLGGIDHRNS
jgi:hypothetical protein